MTTHLWSDGLRGQREEGIKKKLFCPYLTIVTRSGIPDKLLAVRAWQREASTLPSPGKSRYKIPSMITKPHTDH